MFGLNNAKSTVTAVNVFNIPGLVNGRRNVEDKEEKKIEQPHKKRKKCLEGDDSDSDGYLVEEMEMKKLEEEKDDALAAYDVPELAHDVPLALNYFRCWEWIFEIQIKSQLSSRTLVQ
ncbi:hypothetical protein YC2023_020996 [Brassica napus]